MNDRKDGRQAARTTIVGGQPPGNARDLPPIPIGLEELLALAAASKEFEQALLDDREEAIRASGVTLAGTEQQILAVMGDDPLKEMILRVRGQLPEPERRAFLEQAAAAMGVLVGGAAMAGCADKKKDTGRGRSEPPASPAGVRPERPREDPPRSAGPDAGAAKPRPMKTQPPCAGVPARDPRPRPMQRYKTKGHSIKRPKSRARSISTGKTGSRPD